MRIIPFLFSLLMLCSFDGPKLVKTTVAKGVSVSIPADFRQMTNDEMANRYFTFRKPVAMFTSPDQSADLGFNITNSQWRNNDLPMAKDFYLSTIQTMYSKVEFMQKGVLELVNKQQFAVFEFVSEVVDNDEQSLNKGAVTRQYTYIKYTIQNGKVLVFNFTCAARAKDKWKETASAIMKSVRVK